MTRHQKTIKRKIMNIQAIVFCFVRALPLQLRLNASFVHVKRVCFRSVYHLYSSVSLEKYSMSVPQWLVSRRDTAHTV